jgi:hypothetical protein
MKDVCASRARRCGTKNTPKVAFKRSAVKKQETAFSLYSCCLLIN